MESSGNSVSQGQSSAGYGRVAGLLAGLPPCITLPTVSVGPWTGSARCRCVSCFPSGTIREEMHECGSPFAVETTHLKFRNSDLSPSLSVALRRRRQYRESFEVYGSKQGSSGP